MQLPDLSLLLVMAIFWATYAVLRVFILKPLGGILEGRERTVAGATEALAGMLEKEKETLLDIDARLTQARREALAARQAARSEANAKRQAILEATQEKARRLAADAQARLEKDVAAARSELARNARATAVEIASGALGRRIA
ncbi:MAG TPA: ATP synthase F0 subunit B [Thermoanaerobaculia bacterium]|nr:ATP synthase F0 subunit B [Thermoanaerobaculia bacterium]